MPARPDDLPSGRLPSPAPRGPVPLPRDPRPASRGPLPRPSPFGRGPRRIVEGPRRARCPPASRRFCATPARSPRSYPIEVPAEVRRRTRPLCYTCAISPLGSDSSFRLHPSSFILSNVVLHLCDLPASPPSGPNPPGHAPRPGHPRGRRSARPSHSTSLLFRHAEGIAARESREIPRHARPGVLTIDPGGGMAEGGFAQLIAAAGLRLCPINAKKPINDVMHVTFIGRPGFAGFARKFQIRLHSDWLMCRFRRTSNSFRRASR
jgi:hypothetical protein